MHKFLFLNLLALSFVTAAPAFRPELNAALQAQMPLEEGWQNPPHLARTRVWWWWLNGNTDRETITRDLEAMKANGIGGANIIDAGGDDQRGNLRVKHGPDFGSPEWRTLFKHAVAEAERLGLELGFNIQSGWNLGGPGVTVEESSKRVTFSISPAKGGQMVEMKLAVPDTQLDFYRDVAVVAWPAGEPMKQGVKVETSSAQDGGEAGAVLDGDESTFWVSGGKKPGEGPGKKKSEWIELNFGEPTRADKLVITPRPRYGPKHGVIQAVTDGKAREVLRFSMKAEVPATLSFPEVEAEAFRIVITDAWDTGSPSPRNVQVAEIALFSDDKAVASGGSKPQRIRDTDQKAYFTYPGSFTGTESWHLLDASPEGSGAAICQPGDVVDLTDRMDASGKLRWNAPPGRWEILRFGYTSSGSHVSTHSENAGGLAIDYLDRASFDAYWGRTVEPILSDVKPFLGKSLCFLHTDSWELGPVNWTRRMPEEFQRLRGYDIKPWLPVIAGRIVGNRENSTRFLNDFRRTLADLMTLNKYEGFAEKAHAAGLGIHPESGGPHAGPMDALRNLGVSDIPMGEFWSRSPQHRVQDYKRFFVKQTTSAAHTYGRRISLAEAFTNIGRYWQHDPRSLKPTFDRAACEGHNLTMWHTFSSSTKQQGMPGAAYFAGEHFNPNVTWWSQGKAFVSYMNRCHFMLQQGLGSNDVLHFYGENVPSFVRLKRDDPAKCMPGHDYDVIDMRALLERTSVDAAGNVVLPDGTSYRILSITPHDAISLPVMRHLADLVEKGATMVGPRPKRQYSLTGGKAGDEEFTRLCDRLWGTPPIEAGQNPVGKGRVIWGTTTWEVFAAEGISPDFTWSGGDDQTLVDFIHRRTDDTQIYFVANRNDRPEKVELRFRVSGLLPEFWDPVTGKQRDATDFRCEKGVTIIPYPLNGEESLFVLFRKPIIQASGKPNVPELDPVAAIDGPWTVSFDPKWGGPASVVFETLTDWSKNANDGIRHYSGSAVYQKTFTAPAINGPVFLDLGNVESLCEVSLNGEDLGVLWSAPFRIDVSGRLKPGQNRLRVKVVNLWPNRIIGDASLPEKRRLTQTNITQLTKTTPLEPSGLLGPVKLLAPAP